MPAKAIGTRDVFFPEFWLSFDYVARTAGGRMMTESPADSSFERARTAYRYDFLDFMSGDRKDNPGFQSELIYSDLPQDERFGRTGR